MDWFALLAISLYCSGYCQELGESLRVARIHLFIVWALG